MAVLVEALSVIIRREAIARRYTGGWPGFVADAEALNSTLCADSEIARLGFMHPDDVGTFLKQLERKGFVFLSLAGESIDIVVVDQREGPTTPCKWIEFFRQEIPGGAVSAVRLVGSQDQSLICPDGWQFEHSLSHSFEFYPGRKVDDNLELIRNDFGTDVMRDRETGREVYLNRPPSLSFADQEQSTPDVEKIRLEHNRHYEEACSLLKPYLKPGTRLVSAEDVERVVQGCAALERSTSLVPANWSAWWALGMARRLLLDQQGAYAAFARAYGLNPNEIEIGRNLAAECINLGYAQQAIEVSGAMIRLAPHDAGLIANHALACLIGGELEIAAREADRACELDPHDEITMDLRKLINDVRAGRVQAPSKMSTY